MQTATRRAAITEQAMRRILNIRIPFRKKRCPEFPNRKDTNIIAKKYPPCKRFEPKAKKAVKRSVQKGGGKYNGQRLTLAKPQDMEGEKGQRKNVKKIGKSQKKHLTFKSVCDIIVKLSQESSPMRYQGKRIRQKSLKKLKKVLKNS